jgi:putative membrane protein
MNVGAELMIGALLVSALPFPGAGAGRSSPDELAATESGSNAPTLAQEKDKAFVIKASQAGRKEIADARMALQFSNRRDTRKLAAALQQDHTKVSATLQAIVKAKGWNIPEAETVRAAGLRANTFTDEHYLAQQLKAHDEAITLFKDESTTGADPDLRKLAGQTVETLQAHRSMIQAMLPGSETSRNQ